ncbi:helix-turn-helix transcriptional regulator [Marinicaulis aureus]|uniref:Helix-turn-helix transcriptional regulator n=1 Tax=Hyphococcus aureus TaxID=2666033 RepID=A0ABW1L2R6_9PROT
MEPHFAKAAERLTNAPLSGDWAGALCAVAKTVGGISCNLFTLSADGKFLSAVAPTLTPDALEKISAGNDRTLKKGESKNPVFKRSDVSAGWSWTEQSFFMDLQAAFGAPHFSALKLNVGLSDSCLVYIPRSQPQENMTQAQRGALHGLASLFESAVHIQLQLERRAISLVLNSWDRAGVAAFHCEPDLTINASSDIGAYAIEDSRILSSKNGKIRVSNSSHREELRKAVLTSCIYSVRIPEVITFPLSSPDGAWNCTLAVMTLPRDRCAAQISTGAILLLLPSMEQNARDRQTLAGLTGAEQEIALLLAGGVSTRGIAQKREVSVSTVQTQIKSINQKLSTRHRGELLTKLKTIFN